MNLLLKSRPFVVLLGNSPITSIIISALNKDYDIAPYLYANTRPHYIPGVLKYKFIRLKYIDNSYYTIHKLLDFNSVENNRYTSILIPLTKPYEKLVENHINEIETSYILKSYTDLIASLPTILSKKELYFESL